MGPINYIGDGLKPLWFFLCISQFKPSYGYIKPNLLKL